MWCKSGWRHSLAYAYSDEKIDYGNDNLSARFG